MNVIDEVLVVADAFNVVVGAALSTKAFKVHVLVFPALSVVVAVVSLVLVEIVLVIVFSLQPLKLSVHFTVNVRFWLVHVDGALT